MEKNNYKYYTCKYDAAFKEVFMNTKDTYLLKVLLEFILNVKISSIDIQNNELINDNVHVRRKLLDFLVYTDQGVFNIEVNTSVDKFLRNRNFSFIANAFSKDVLKGDNYNPDIKYVQINLSYGLNYNEAYRKFLVMDDNKNKYIDNFIIYEFNMDYYLNFWYNKDEKEIEKNKYLIMLNLDKDDLKALSKGDKVVSSYMDRLNKVNEDPRFQSYMSAEEDDRKIKNSIKREYYDKGVVEGVRASANKLIESGMSIEEACKILDISEDDLR